MDGIVPKSEHLPGFLVQSLTQAQRGDAEL